MLKRIGRSLLPKPARRRLAGWARRLTRRPPVGRVDFGDLRRLRPISGDWGFDRGTPVDRHYLGSFLSNHAGDVRGRVLEVGTNAMTLGLGGANVTRSDVLHVSVGDPPVTIVGDLATGGGLPIEAFDCVIATQTLQFIYDAAAAVRTIHRMLRPGGVALVTGAGISRISRYDMERWGEHWRFTSCCAQKLFEEVFPPENVTVETFGNVLAAVAFLHGVAAEELTREELAHHDPDYEVLVAVRVVRPEVS
ncbi:MAG: methyltransferase domain-containing protein [Deferrisomatales bacterium]|nr:methyltransferase domain-containing protein [Deferrisomatales bacterium]